MIDATELAARLGVQVRPALCVWEWRVTLDDRIVVGRGQEKRRSDALAAAGLARIRWLMTQASQAVEDEWETP